MKKNMGSLDKNIRLVIAIIIAGLYATNIITGVWGTVLLVLAILFLVTGLLNFCPAYLPFGISTRKDKKV